MAIILISWTHQGAGLLRKIRIITLMAVDSAVMVIDSAKGIEPQTKLFEVCSMRGIPIFTFINKLDRDGLEPLELIMNLKREY